MAKAQTTIRSAFSTYTLLEKIGEGGGGRVYRAQNDDQALCAVKVLRAESATKEKLKRFKNELYFCLRAANRHIVRVLDYGETDENGRAVPFYVMPYYLDTLRTLLRTGITPLRGHQLALKLLDAVEAAHLLGTSHRDLKPENIFFDKPSDLLILGDFGAAAFAPEQMATELETAPHTRLANFLYSAPEQRRTGLAVDHRADLYALGVLVNELFTGQVLQGAGYRRVAEAAAQYGYYDAIVEWLVQHDPQRRPESVDAIKSRLAVLANAEVSRQKLSSLSQTVVSADDPDDPYIADPPRIASVDYHNKALTFTLSRSVSEDWISAFRQINYHTSMMGASPADFRIRDNQAVVLLQYNEPTPENVQRVVDDFKRFLELTTTDYTKRSRRARQQQEERKRQALAEEIEQERRRQEILKHLQL